MTRLPLDGDGARDGAVGFDELVGRERRAALLALVAVGAVVAALGAGADDVAVGKEGAGLLVVVLHRALLDELALVVELAEELRSGLGVGGRRGARVDVERHAEALERTLDEFVVAVDNLLRGDALLAGLDGDGHAVLVGAANRDDVAVAQTQVAGIDVRRYVNARQMADVNGAIGIGERRSDQIALEFFSHR